MPVKISQLDALATPDPQDRLVTVDDPGGTPTSKTIEVQKIRQHSLLYDNTLSVAAANIDITGISQDYDDLIILGQLRSDTAATATNLSMFFNNDTTVTNYHWQRHWVADSSHTVSEGASNLAGTITAGTSPAGSYAFFRAIIHEYTSTIKLKLAICTSYFLQAAATVTAYYTMLSWEDGGATAINRITLQGSAGNMDAGSRVRIIGRTFGG